MILLTNHVHVPEPIGQMGLEALLAQQENLLFPGNQMAWCLLNGVIFATQKIHI